MLFPPVNYLRPTISCHDSIWANQNSASCSARRFLDGIALVIICVLASLRYVEPANEHFSSNATVLWQLRGALTAYTGAGIGETPISATLHSHPHRDAKSPAAGTTAGTIITVKTPLIPMTYLTRLASILSRGMTENRQHEPTA